MIHDHTNMRMDERLKKFSFIADHTLREILKDKEFTDLLVKKRILKGWGVIDLSTLILGKGVKIELKLKLPEEKRCKHHPNMDSEGREIFCDDCIETKGGKK